jgi:hypothetical protein
MDLNRAMAMLKAETSTGWPVVAAYRAFETAELESALAEPNEFEEKTANVMTTLGDLVSAAAEWVNSHGSSQDPLDVDRVEASHLIHAWATNKARQTGKSWEKKIYMDNVTNNDGKFSLQAITSQSQENLEKGVIQKLGPVLEGPAGKDLTLSEAGRAALRLLSGDEYGYINPATARDRNWMKDNKTRHPKGPGAAFIEPRGKAKGLSEPELDEYRMSEGPLHAYFVEEALEKLPIYEKDVYRGETVADAEFNRIREEKKVVFKHILSTSASESVTDTFIETGDGSKAIVYIIHNSGGRHVGRLSQHESEDEVMVFPGTFNVKNSEYNEKTKRWKIELTRA